MFKLLTIYAITLLARTPTDPTLLHKNAKTYNYLAVNPLLQPIEMTIDCFANYEKITLSVPARTSQELLIKRPDGLPADTCVLSKWRDAQSK